MSQTKDDVLADLAAFLEEQQQKLEDLKHTMYNDDTRHGLQMAMDCVAAFHVKMDVNYFADVTKPFDSEVDFVTLQNSAAMLHTYAKAMLARYLETKDVRLLRNHLIAEEFAEFIDAILKRDEVEALDALADLMYVIIGTAISLQLPLPEAFVEVHCSNMTKERQVTDPEGGRVRQKGPNYKAPDLRRVLDLFRGIIPEVSQAEVRAETERALQARSPDEFIYGDDPSLPPRRMEVQEPSRNNGHNFAEHGPHALCVHCGKSRAELLAYRNCMG